MDYETEQELSEIQAELRAMQQSQKIRDQLAENVAAFINNPSATNYNLLVTEMCHWQEWHQIQNNRT